MPRPISAVMTRKLAVISPAENAQRAAQMMAEWNVGALPVCDSTHLVGMLTDRDIVVRALAAGKAADGVKVADIMSRSVNWCFDDQSIGEALQAMGQARVRRIPVIARASGELVGMITLGDIATRTRADINGALDEICFPSEPVRRDSYAERSCIVLTE